MNILMTILYILLFIFCLSTLIMIHELGHFMTAKIFKVYVQEYSIGFGPALIHKKRKTGETYFSLRVIPFGGYVSMYQEGVELEDSVKVDESRSLDGVKKWKRAIIMVAGVTMNSVLALHLFFIYNVAFSNQVCYYNNASVAEGSKAEICGIKTEDMIALDSFINENKANYSGDLHLIDDQSIVTKTNTDTVEAFTYMDLSKFTNYKNLSLNKFIVIYGCKLNDKNEKVADFTTQISVDETFASLDLHITTVDAVDEKHVPTIKTIHTINIVKDGNGLEDFGYSLYLHVEKPLPFFKAIGQSFVDFGESSTMIVRALGTMFTKSTWESMGGIVAIGFQSTSILQNFGWGKFIYLWGALSVNLAIINLLPFPGLDGWQLLVLAVEGISKKKIPNKVKTIISFVGLALLFTFMAVLVVKDIITYIL